MYIFIIDKYFIFKELIITCNVQQIKLIYLKYFSFHRRNNFKITLLKKQKQISVNIDILNNI